MSCRMMSLLPNIQALPSPPVCSFSQLRKGLEPLLVIGAFSAEAACASILGLESQLITRLSAGLLARGILFTGPYLGLPATVAAQIALAAWSPMGRRHLTYGSGSSHLTAVFTGKAFSFRDQPRKVPWLSSGLEKRVCMSPQPSTSPTKTAPYSTGTKLEPHSLKWMRINSVISCH